MSEPDFRQIAPDFWVAPQIAVADLAAARAMGIRTVINNRPDGEAPGQLADHEAKAAAMAAGLAYAFVPVVSGAMTMADVEAFGRAVEANDGPYLAYCRSGTRSSSLWALDAARRQEPATIIEAARRAGYDLSGLVPALGRIHDDNAAGG
jgi:sulfide:quinone oxidoreductase